MSFKDKLKKFWNFLWNAEDTFSYILSTIVLFIIIFLLVKFIFFPILSFALATKFPAVIVLTNSMNHYGKDFDSWWEEHKQYYEEFNISKSEFNSFFSKDGLSPGDLVIVHGIDPEKINVGDIIVYEGNANYPIIHRVVRKDVETKEGTTLYIFTTKGDANPSPIVRPGMNEYFIVPDQIYGKAIFVVPKVGLLKIWLYSLFTKA